MDWNFRNAVYRPHAADIQVFRAENSFPELGANVQNFFEDFAGIAGKPDVFFFKNVRFDFAGDAKVNDKIFVPIDRRDFSGIPAQFWIIYNFLIKPSFTVSKLISPKNLDFIAFFKTSLNFLFFFSAWNNL